MSPEEKDSAEHGDATQESAPRQGPDDRDAERATREFRSFSRSLSPDDLHELQSVFVDFGKESRDFVAILRDLREMRTLIDMNNLRDIIEELLRLFRKLRQQPRPWLEIVIEILELIIKILKKFR